MKSKLFIKRFKSISKRYLTLLFLALSSQISGQNAYHFKIDNWQSGSVRIHFYLDDYNITKDEFSTITIKGAGQSSLSGSPLIPIVSAWLALASQNSAVCSTRIIKSENLGSITMAEVTRPMSRNPDDSNVLNQNNHFKYADDFQKGIFARCVPTTKLFGVDAMNILCYPLQYNAENRHWTLIKEAEIEIHFQKPQDVSLKRSDHLPKGIFINKTPLTGRSGKATKKAPNMLVIAADRFADSIQAFIDWKKQQGINTKLVLTSELHGFLSPQIIKNRIMQAWQDSAGLDYVILVGDYNLLPPYYGINNTLTDHYYTTLDTGNYLPDISIGRFSVNTEEACGLYVRKLINYEKTPVLYTNNWYDKAMVISSNDGLDNQHGIQMRQYFLNHGMQYVDDYRDITNQNTLENVKSSLEEGRSWVFYIGHGSSTAWATVHPYFSTSSIDQTNNKAFIPAIISIACSNADIDYPGGDCFAERWLKTGPGRGAVSIMAATENSAFYWTDTLGKNMVFGYFDHQVETFGQAMDYGKWAMYNAFPQGAGGLTEETMQQHMILGDPTLQAFTKTPSIISMDYKGKEAPGMHPISIHISSNKQAVAGALVCLYNADYSVYHSHYTDSLGNIVFQVDVPSSGTLSLQVTGRNLIPAKGCIQISEINGIKPFNTQNIRIYPNPASHIIHISSPESVKGRLQIFDAEGSLITDRTFSKQENINIDRLLPGYYQVQINTNQSIYRSSFIKIE